MYYAIRHVTRFRYNEPITESITEVRKQPRTNFSQRCDAFDLTLSPKAKITSYTDHLHNQVHHFNVPGPHKQLYITAESLVETEPTPDLPPQLPLETWNSLDAETAQQDFWDWLLPSHFARPTELLAEFAAELKLDRAADPLTTLNYLNTQLFERIGYAPQTTTVDSGIDDALKHRAGVCQDLSHIMISLVRGLKIPCRYVSGYLFHRTEDQDRSAEDATHAWVEAWLPELGWIGFDPTNNLIAGERHITVAIGRDYADVPPTRGVFRGDAARQLSVGVQVRLTERPTTNANTTLNQTDLSDLQWQTLENPTLPEQKAADPQAQQQQ